MDDLAPAIVTIADLIRERDQKVEEAVVAAAKSYPKRRGELRAEYTRRILRIVRSQQ